MSESSKDNKPDGGGGELYSVGYVLKPRGLSGELKVRVLCDDAEHFRLCIKQNDAVWLYRDPGVNNVPRTDCCQVPDALTGQALIEQLTQSQKSKDACIWAKVSALRFHNEVALMRFEGIDRVEDAALLRGYSLGLTSAQLPRDNEDDYYLFQLEGLAVFDQQSGDLIGRVLGIEENMAHVQLLVGIEGQGKPSFRIPLIDAFIKKVDIKTQRIEADLPPLFIESQM